MGDGGALVTNSPGVAERIEMLRQYGWSEKYRIEIPFGMNSRLDELQAAILRLRLKNIDSVNEIRRGILEKYSESIRGSMCRLVTSFTPKSSAHLAILQFPTEKEKNFFQEKMINFRIKTDVHYPFLDCDQPGLKSASATSELPESRKSLNKILTLPLTQNLKSDEISRICVAVEAVTSATR
jgi:dTDP-4-amino-4,6-dideoxygalactose transaminase